MKHAIIGIALALMLATVVAAQTTGEPTIGYRDLSITYLNQDPDPAEPGNNVDVRFRLENVGATTVQNLEVELIPEFPLTMASGEEAMRDLGNVDPSIKNEKAIVLRWRLRLDPSAAEGEYELKIRYSTNDGQSYTTIEDIFVHVQSIEKILSVAHVEVEPSSVRPGQDAKITFGLRNYASSLVQNVKIDLNLASAPFGVLDSSTQKVIERISGGELQDVTFRLVPNSDAELKVYNIPFTLSYMDTSGAEYDVNSSFGLRVDADPEFVLNVEENNAVTAGSTGEIVISISNTGPSDIKFVALSITPGMGYEVIGPNLKYLGNLESDDFETETFTIRTTLTAAEALTLNIQATFKDSYNRAYERMETLTTPIYSKAEARALGLTPPAGVSPLVIIAILVVLIGGFIWWRRRRKRR